MITTVSLLVLTLFFLEGNDAASGARLGLRSFWGVAAKPITASRVDTSPLKTLALTAGIGCSGYLCAVAFSNAHNRILSEQIEDFVLELKNVKLEQQYLKYNIQEMNHTFHNKLKLTTRRIMNHSDLISNKTKCEMMSWSQNATLALTNVTEEIDLINNLKIYKLNRKFEEEITSLRQSVKALEKDFPVHLKRSEDELLKHIDKQGAIINRIMKNNHIARKIL